MLRAYNEVAPGLLDRLLGQTERVSEHALEMERLQVEASVENMRRDYAEGRWGQICGLIFGVVTVVGGVYGATHAVGMAAQIAGGVIGAGGVGTIITSFIYGRKNPRRETASSSASEAERTGGN